MSLIALLLLITAAVLHTGWNLLVKRAREKQIFTWWAMLVGTACFAPLLAFSAPLPAAIWPYVLTSALVETIYYLALLRAYSIGDFSLIYPMARGAAPAFLALWAALFLGERPQAGGILGLTLLLIGLLLVGGAARRAALRQGSGALALGGIPAPALRNPDPSTSPSSRRDSSGDTVGRGEVEGDGGVGGAATRPRWSLMALAGSATAAALTVACCISIYSVIDGAAVRIAPPIPYTVAVIGASALMMTPVVLVRYGHPAVLAEWRANWARIVLVGLLTLITYALVLQAYSIGRVSYAGAVREISVVFAALVGWRWLGEGFGGWRVTGALLIFAGILAIAILG
jgi:drug/metabolite transporter (DMT)-like permease